MSDLGLISYTFFFPLTLDPLGGTNTVFGGLITGEDTPVVGPRNSARQAHLARRLRHILPAENVLIIPRVVRENYDTTQAGFNNYTGLRLLDKATLAGNLTGSADTSARFVNGTIEIVHLMSGKAVHNARPTGGDNLVLPVWRKSYVQLRKCLIVP